MVPNDFLYSVNFFSLINISLDQSIIWMTELGSVFWVSCDSLLMSISQYTSRMLKTLHHSNWKGSQGYGNMITRYLGTVWTL